MAKTIFLFMRRAVAIFFTLCAQVIILAHMVVPHHHHGGAVAVVSSEVHNSLHSHDATHSHANESYDRFAQEIEQSGHHHGDDGRCMLSDDFLRQSNSNSVSRDVYFAALYAVLDCISNQIFQVEEPIRYSPCRVDNYASTLMLYNGLRAPPVC